MRVIAIIQARMGSTRLPGKTMLDLCGKPVVQHVVERVTGSRETSEIWLATTTSAADDRLAQWSQQNSILCFRGDENDVLDRYYQAAKRARADVVVRITGDCPLHDYRIIDKVIKEFKDGKYDYVSNVHPPTFPDGLDVEVFSFNALERAHKEAVLTSEREHVTSYIWNHPEKFKMKNVFNARDLSKHRWTLDTKKDAEFIGKILEACRHLKKSELEDILDILRAHPEWSDINANYQRNEGYLKSLKNDTK